MGIIVIDIEAEYKIASNVGVKSELYTKLISCEHTPRLMALIK